MPSDAAHPRDARHVQLDPNGQTDDRTERRTERQIIKRIAERYPRHYMRGYARGKLHSDPVYNAVRDCLGHHALPVLDIGCGIGLCALYLREHGFAAPIVGIDPDAKKIALARRAGSAYADLSFEQRDGAEPAPIPGHVTMLDVLHYFAPPVQRALLERVVAHMPPGGRCVIRTTLADGSWRFRLTQWEECFAHAVRWMRHPALAFPTRDAITAPFEQAGFVGEVRPLWGRTPFNSYLFTFHRPAPNERPNAQPGAQSGPATGPGEPG